jgi:hypothetical protein
MTRDITFNEVQKNGKEMVMLCSRVVSQHFSGTEAEGHDRKHLLRIFSCSGPDSYWVPLN